MKKLGKNKKIRPWDSN